MAGGGYRTDGAPGAFPLQLPEKYHLWKAEAGTLSVFDTAGRRDLSVELRPHLEVLLQDNRKWSDHFAALLFLHEGPMTAGQRLSADVKVRFTEPVNIGPAALALDAARVRYKVLGMGGNYCFSVNTPVTQYTLENLRPAYARTEMKSYLLDPGTEGRTPTHDDWVAAVEAADTPGSPIRHDLELARILTQKSIPFIISIWRLPDRMYTKPPDDPHAGNNLIAAGKWPEVLDSISAYLLHARDRYGVEPGLFSFNEPNIGVRVAFTPEEHRDVIKRIGARFREKGLRTKMLLADASPAVDTQAFGMPAGRDRDAMEYVGAVSFHSWGGASPQQYAAWAGLARQLGLPLIVAEAGVDSGAWRDRSFASFPYAMREMVHYQELFLHARPQAVLRWEYSDDYSLVDRNQNTGDIRPAERFCLQKHWCAFIPPGSENLATASDSDAVLFTAFRCYSAKSAKAAFATKHERLRPGASGGKPGDFDYSLHLSNVGPTRKARLVGVPRHISSLNAVRTAQNVLFRKLDAVTVRDGRLTLSLPRDSLTTLTTFPVPALSSAAAEGTESR
jgi:hypothetical protein